jgi:hypothetical protein
VAGALAPGIRLLGDLVTAMWVGAVDPRLVNLTDPYPDSSEDPAKGPVGAYLRTVRDCYGLALEFEGALHSYAESGLVLVDYVMPNAAYRTWRRASYPRLEGLTSSFAMHEVGARLPPCAGPALATPFCVPGIMLMTVGAAAAEP